MTRKADVIIIGGGVVGMSIACHLAWRGHGSKVIVLERSTIGSGSTSRSVGGIRSQFSTEVNIQMSLESIKFWRGFETAMGMPSDYRETGYLFLARSPAVLAQFHQNVKLQRSLGVDSSVLDRSELASVAPYLQTDDLAGAAYCATDGMAGPYEATQAFALKAREGGVTILEEAEVVGIGLDHGQVESVQTKTDTFHTNVVVNAAGPWAASIGNLAGVTVPVRPYRREIFVSEPFPRDLIGDCPLVIDLEVGWYFRREGEGILMSGSKDSESTFDTHVDWSKLPNIAEVASKRVPILAKARFGRTAWAGLYDVSPDDHAILGAVPGVPGFYCANGFSGHGFQHSPATGRLLADLIIDGKADGIDISPLSITRFETGQLLREPLTAHAGSMGV
jgi:sarcosine oxidase subunit beta